jgi:hypothetical protein
MLLTYWNCGDVSPDDACANNGYDPADLPPEFCRYRDEGCRYADSCLDCPYPCCLEELPSRDTAVIRCIQRAVMLEEWDRGATRREISRRFRVSYRTVIRLVGQGRACCSGEALYVMEKSLKEKGELYDTK